MSGTSKNLANQTLAGSEPPSSSDIGSESKYTVVARRYRPKTFEDLVGQDTVAQALLRAIETHRVGHAYLFTGARGVGKTSTARIFAKALNASEDGSGRFDPHSEISLAIDSGEDMDVIEIDGASNRGIDEIRQLRANASIRPSRSRFKIYIIDEVHMLTTQAFNALLKTLEEPPGHVKFIFCTTDPEKIPITVLSRCQRFDFPPVHSDQILQRLQFICSNEGTEADDDALRLIARRAAGSMRDSQSLLEQLLSFGGHRITVDDVHAMLGTADETRLASFAQCMVDRNAAGALLELDAAISAGVDPGQLAEQLLGYLRDMMALSIGGPVELMRTANPNSADALRRSGQAWGTMTLLSTMQLLDETIVRMKHSVQSRILFEVALVQICNLQDLQLLSDVVQGLASGHAPAMPAGAKAPSAPALKPPASTSPSSTPKASTPTVTSSQTATPPIAASPAAALPRDQASVPRATAPPASATSSNDSKKKVDELTQAKAASPASPPEAPIPATAPATVISDESKLDLFRRVITPIQGVVQQAAWMAIEIQAVAEGRWRVHLARDAKFAVDWFRKPENEGLVRDALRSATGQDIAVEWQVTDRAVPPGAKPADTVIDATQPSANSAAPVGQNQRIREAMNHPLIKRFMEVFDGHVIRVDDPSAQSVPAPKSVPTITPNTTASQDLNAATNEFDE